MLDAIIHLTDLHFWSLTANPFRLLGKRAVGQLNVVFHRRRHFDHSGAAELISHLKEVGAPLLLITGDFTSTAMREEFAQAAEFLAQVEQAGVRVALVPGNHDRYTFRSTHQRLLEGILAPFCPKDGWPHLLRTSSGNPVLLLDEARPNPFSARGAITERDLSTVAGLLEELAREGRLLVAAGHYPLLTRTPLYSLRPGRRLRGAQRLRALLAGYPYPVLYLYGHVHRSTFFRDHDQSRLFHLSTKPAFMRRHGGAAELALTHIGIAADGFEVHWHRRAAATGWEIEEANAATLADQHSYRLGGGRLACVAADDPSR